jgi:tripartite-type tricarboxylate transporter receptor subunit TctC
LLATLLAGVPPAHAQDYPARQVTVIVPFAPGGSADITARLYAQKLSERWGKPVVVENRAGAGTVVGATAAARAEPDGYTLFMGGSSALAYNPALYKQLPYDPAKDFVPVAYVGALPFVLVAQPDGPIRSIADLVKLAKEKPGHLAFGTAGKGSPAHLCAEYLRSVLGIDITYIPYKGSAPAITDFLGGRVPVMFVDLPPVLALIREGKMRALGLSSARRVNAAPEIPPLAEVGVPGYEAGGWLMFATPAATPPEVVAKLHADMKAVTALPDVEQRFAGMGVIRIDSPPLDQLKAFVRSEIERWGKVIRAAGLAESQ